MRRTKTMLMGDRRRRKTARHLARDRGRPRRGGYDRAENRKPHPLCPHPVERAPLGAFLPARGAQGGDQPPLGRAAGQCRDHPVKHTAATARQTQGCRKTGGRKPGRRTPGRRKQGAKQGHRKLGCRKQSCRGLRTELGPQETALSETGLLKSGLTGNRLTESVPSKSGLPKTGSRTPRANLRPSPPATTGEAPKTAAPEIRTKKGAGQSCTFFFSTSGEARSLAPDYWMIAARLAA